MLVKKYLHVIRYALILLVMAVSNGSSFASQPTSPVDIEVSYKSTGKPNSAIAIVKITANTELKKAELVFKVDRKSSLKIKSKKVKIDLKKNKSKVIRIPISIGKAGTHKIDFRIKAKAKGYKQAGTVERRYIVADGKKSPKILTGTEVRRDIRKKVDSKLKKQLRKDPEAGVSIDNFLRGSLKPIKKSRKIKKGKKQALVPPALGIEPYEASVVLDKTADVIRDLDPLTIMGRIYYTNRSGVLTPLVNATVDIRDSDVGFDEQLTSVITDWNGDFSAVVNNDDGWFQNGRDIYIRVRATNGRFRVQDCAAWPDWTYSWVSDVRNDLSDGTVVNFGSTSTTTNNEASIIFQDLNQGWSFLTSTGAQDPGFVDACWPEGASVYSTFWEEIDIEDGDEVARDIVLHEYGHATMHNAYNGYWPSNTGGPHGFDDNLHQNMAFTEGWGTFIALSVNNDGVYNSNGWSRNIESFSHNSGHSNNDGQTNEAHVAAAMNDVRDSNADGSCSGGADCDSSGANSASMVQIWRDAFWRSNSDNIADYWPRLCSELNNAQEEVALKALGFNDIDLSGCKCTATVALSTSSKKKAATSLKELRVFRDRALRNTEIGRRIINLYYRHTAEVTRIMFKDKKLLKTAATLFGRAVSASKILRAGKSKSKVMIDSKHAKMSFEFIRHLQKSGSNELKQDFDEVYRLIEQLEGRSYEEVYQKFSNPSKKK